ncbi:MAG TPA: O-acetylhomoserine aminocarboxypropyltransferase/cysteine synthase [Aggregatilineales bacterium]|nr:O-acetylhomoserine aminocarboxypropyltransferase/cysteine synthase [Anaerolineales bacterium]HRE49210.1 O-acetylhomoserine aminocarboxypropyltransferase/cysteine synthase [Aggregatilineales bacterium]
MSQSKRKFGFETRMLHAGYIPEPVTGARAVPIFQTTSYVFEDSDKAAQLFELKQYGNIYTRINNPTTAAFEERIASLENATGAVATASGMAAQFAVFMTLLNPGDEIVASAHLYGGTVTQFTHTFKKLGIKTHFVDPTNLDRWAKAITPQTKALYGETIGNPKGSILDIAPLADLAHAHNIPLIVDSTFATPYLCRPMDWGADLVVHSATKFIGGHGNSIAGVLLDSGRFDFSRFPTIADPDPAYHELRFYETFGHYGFLMKARAVTLRDTGAALSPFNSFLLIQGLETLSVRMDRHVQNAHAVAAFLNDHPKVAWVAYAGLPDSPYHALAQKYTPKGPGAVFTFGIKGENPRQAGKTFIEGLHLFSHLANVGDARSLVIHPASTTHQQLSDAELEAGGVSPAMIRLSIGLETTEDLLWDLDQALQAT